MAETKRAKREKHYYLVCATDGYYCVPTRHLSTADATNVRVGEQVRFSYGSQSKTGEVIFISSSETEVISEMKRVKSERRTKAESFHEDQPRKSALRQRERMKELHSGNANKVPIIKEEVSLAESKKAKKRLKDKSQLLMDCELMEGHQSSSQSSQSKLVDQTPSNDGTLSPGSESKVSPSESAISNSDTSSISSVEPMNKVKVTNIVDVKALKTLERESDSDTSNREAKIDGFSPAVSSPQDLFDKELPSSSNVDTLGGSDQMSVHSDDSHQKESQANSSNLKRSRCVSSKSVSSRSSSASNSSSEDKKGKKRKHKKKSKKQKKSKKSEKHKKARKLDTTSDEEDRELNIVKNSDKSEGEPKKEESFKKKEDNVEKEDKDKIKDDNDNINDDTDEMKDDKGVVKGGNDKMKKDKGADKHKKRKKGKKKSKSKKHKKHRGVRRNFELYPGEMYLHSEKTPGAVKVHDKFDKVFIPQDTLQRIITQSRSLPLLVKNLVHNVFTKDALMGSTAQGYPNRVQGSRKLRQKDVLPRLDPDGREAILQRAELEQENKKEWRPRIKAKYISQYFSQAVGDMKTQAKSDDSSSSTDSSSDSSSTSESSSSSSSSTE